MTEFSHYVYFKLIKLIKLTSHKMEKEEPARNNRCIIIINILYVLKKNLLLTKRFDLL